MDAATLETYLANGEGAAAAPVAETILILAKAALVLRDEIMVGALAASFGEFKGTRNAGGDAQKGLDLYADERFLEMLGDAPVAVYASEEREDPVLLNAGAPLALAIDPLDGSSNIDTNVSIGTIFSILPVKGDPEADKLASFLQPGNTQLAAGFFIYGPQLALVLTLGKGTQVFVYSPGLQSFVHARTNIAVPQKTAEFAINAANQRYWDPAVRHYVDDCLRGVEGPHGRDFNMRWVASLVAETYRILMRGGVFLYPGDSRRGYANGRLRHVYEASPIALLIEQAGGLASDCSQPLLELVPTSLHQRVPLVFGSSTEVQQVRRYHADLEPAGLRSPLFGSRGLFRN